MDGKRPKSHPKKIWEDAVTVDAREILGVRGWMAFATDRERWRVRIEAVSYTHLDVYKRQP